MLHANLYNYLQNKTIHTIGLLIYDSPKARLQHMYIHKINNQTINTSHCHW